MDKNQVTNLKVLLVPDPLNGVPGMVIPWVTEEFSFILEAFLRSKGSKKGLMDVVWCTGMNHGLMVGLQSYLEGCLAMLDTAPRPQRYYKEQEAWSLWDEITNFIELLDTGPYIFIELDEKANTVIWRTSQD